MPCGGCKDELICVRGCRAAAMALLSLLVLLLLLLRVRHWIYCLETRHILFLGPLTLGKAYIANAHIPKYIPVTYLVDFQKIGLECF